MQVPPAETPLYLMGLGTSCFTGLFKTLLASSAEKTEQGSSETVVADAPLPHTKNSTTAPRTAGEIAGFDGIAGCMT
jgi:hypothetical protein